MATLKVETAVLGLDDVRKKMLALPRAIGGKLVRNALRDGAMVMALEARRLAPVQKGKKGGLLKKSIQGESDRPRRNDSVILGRVVVRRRGQGARNPRAYAHLVEFGTQPHAVGKGSRVKASRRGRVKQIGPLHPGTKPRPFVQPAFESKRAEALEVIAARLRSDIEATVANNGVPPGKGES